MNEMVFRFTVTHPECGTVEVMAKDGLEACAAAAKLWKRSFMDIGRRVEYKLLWTAEAPKKKKTKKEAE